MHEIRATIPPDRVSEATRLAMEIGIQRISVTEVFVYGPNAPRRILSIETSTPKAKAFVDALLSSPTLSNADCTLTSRELRAIVGDEPIDKLTLPMGEPFPDVVQDLWQLSHPTGSYIGRAAAGAILLATGIIENNPIAIVVAALFLPFLSPLLAFSVGVWSRDRRLLLQGIRALLVSTILGIASGAFVAAIQGGPILYDGFKGPLSSLGISAAIGIAAGLSIADDTGRRYLIGVAAAVQLAIFPVWLGAALILGPRSTDMMLQRLLSFAINLTTIFLTVLLAHAWHSQGRGRSLWRDPGRP